MRVEHVAQLSGHLEAQSTSYEGAARDSRAQECLLACIRAV